MFHTVQSLIFYKSVLLRCLTTTHSRFSVTCCNLWETRTLYSAPLTLSQVSDKFSWMPNLGRSLPFPCLLTTMKGFASPWDCKMRHLISEDGQFLFSGLIGNGRFCYLDNLIIVSKDLVIFTSSTLSSPNFKPNVTCSGLAEFLGHVVDGAGIHTVDSKINAVKHFPTPQNVENVRSFLGLAGYYRASVRNFASIASPLTRLLKKMFPSFGMTLTSSFLSR